VYPDALNAFTLVHDDATSDAAIRWSYTNTGAHYVINRKTVIGVNDPIAPPTANSLTEGTVDADSSDSLLRTFSFRNTFYSPVGGPNTAPAGAGPQDGQVMTLVASDGTTVSAPASFMAFVENDGLDRLSGGGVGDRVYEATFTASASGWVQNTVFVGDGGVVSLAQGASGLCADVSAQGTNLSGWASALNTTGVSADAYHTVSLVNNSVYRIRADATTTGQAGLTPLWYIQTENTLSWYGGSFFFYDFGTNPVAGANTPPPVGTHSIFEAWFQPAGGNTAGMQAAVSAPANADFKDFRLRLQMLDVGTNPGNPATDPYGGASDQGAICWKSIEVDRFDANSLDVVSTPYNRTTLTRVTAASVDPDAVTVNDFTASGSTVTNTGGDLQFTPSSTTAWDPQFGGVPAFFQVFPGDNVKTAGQANSVDDYPVPWSANTLYRISITLQAPNPTAETNGIDWLIVGGDVLTNEIIVGNFATTKFATSAMPKQTAQEYVAYWHGNAGTLAAGGATPEFDRMRPYLYCGTNNDFVDVANQGGVNVLAIRVDVVQ
jgi:hypothetical protein